MNQKKFVIPALLAMLFFAGYIFFLAPVVGERRAVRNLEFQEFDLTKVPDGQHSGIFEAGGYPYEVEVTIEAGKIIDIAIINNRSGEHARNAEEIASRVLEAQSLDVDAISGATTTSKALLKAIENALLSAKDQR